MFLISRLHLTSLAICVLLWMYHLIFRSSVEVSSFHLDLEMIYIQDVCVKHSCFFSCRMFSFLLSDIKTGSFNTPTLSPVQSNPVFWLWFQVSCDSQFNAFYCFSAVPCPPNSHYNPCTSACPATCIDPLASMNCSRPCVEGCECNNGFVTSGDQCVSMSNCGCLQNGQYYEVCSGT